jgi:WD40 repeat protein
MRRVGRAASAVWHMGGEGGGTAHSAAVVAAAAIPAGCGRSSPCDGRAATALVTASKDGDLRVWDVAGRCVQHLYSAHAKGTFLNPRCGGGVTQAAVTAMVALDHALVTAGGDGVVKVWPYAGLLGGDAAP